MLALTPLLLCTLHADDLRTHLRLERIERVSVRSQAVFEDTQHGRQVRVTRKAGKWQLYGYTAKGGEQFLHPHEALHLIEIVSSSSSSAYARDRWRPIN